MSAACKGLTKMLQSISVSWIEEPETGGKDGCLDKKKPLSSNTESFIIVAGHNHIERQELENNYHIKVSDKISACG